MSTRLSILMLASIGVAFSAAGQTIPSHERGLSAETAYQAGDLDHVNLFNGNLTLALPIGGVYPVGPGLAYSLTLYYNAQAWDYDEPTSCQDIFGKFHHYTLPKPAEHHNAGFGWTLHLGRLKPAQDSFIYIAPDGSEHFFLPQLHPGYPATPGNAKYTQDGSYLRLRTLSSGCGGGGGCKVVEFPDGSVRQFKTDGSGSWRLTRIADAFGHFLDLSYSPSLWTLTDEHGRIHEIELSGGGRVDRVRLKTFGGAASEWIFTYAATNIPRQDYLPPPCTAPGRFVAVDLLEKVGLPDGSSFRMSYSTTDSMNQMSGGATSLILPTGGKVAWSYGRYFFTSIELPPGSEEGQPWTSTVGVASRQTYALAADSLPLGVWSYVQEEGAFGEGPGDHVSTPCYSKTTVRDPAGNEVEHFFATQKNARSWAYALPFTFCDPSDGGNYHAGGPWVSQQIYQGTAADGELVRTARLEYEGDGPLGSGYQAKNLRLSRSRMTYHDDGDRWQDTAWSEFDGLGHYRSVTQTGNFWTSNPTRVTTTRFNPNSGILVIDRDTSATIGSTFLLPSESSPWHLGRFDSKRVSEAGTSWRSDFCFESSGFLKWRRDLAGTAPQANDLLVLFDQEGTTGRIARQKHFGGDGASLDIRYSETDVCGMDLPPSGTAPAYELRQTYTAGAMNGQWAVDGFGTVSQSDDVDLIALLDVDIDPSTGLAASVRDAAGVATELEYDALGRLSAERPAEDAWTGYSYSLPTASEGPKLTVSRCANGESSCSQSAALGWSRHEYDGLGRRVRELVSYPGSGGSVTESRKFVWHALGWKLAESSWGDESLLTLWDGHDRFGRPASRQLPGKNPLALFKYLGARAVMRQERIVTGFGGTQTWDHKAELLDHLGRLVEVCEGMNGWWAGSCSGEVTQYGYNPRDQLIKVCQHAGTGCGQERFFSFDGRGLLTGERHPEIGSAGNGWTTYSYDGAGRPTSRSIADSAAFDLLYLYDKAGRLLHLRQKTSPTSSRPIKEFFYARANDGDNLQRGKLVRALRHNWVSPTGPIPDAIAGTLDFVVSDHFEFRGRGGRVSQKVTTQRFGTGTRAFRSGFTWNELGLPESLDYPLCLEWPCEDRVPQRTIDLAYAKGLLVEVEDFATLSYQLGGSLIHRVSHENGVVWTQTINTGDRQTRPSSIATSGVAFSSNWSTGVYDYDGVGNIHQIGSTEFRYDRLHRLVEGQVNEGGTRTQTGTYDSYGNLAVLTTGGVALNLAPSPTTNRISGGVYDAAGNLTQISLGGVLYQYGFEAGGQLEYLKSNNQQAKVYFYDAADERLMTWDCPGNSCGDGSAWERWTLRGLGGEVLRAFEGKSSDTLAWKEDYIYRGRQALAAVRPTSSGIGEDQLAIHVDHLGSTRQVTNGAGQQVERHTFYPFGEEVTVSSPGDLPLKLAGHERDRNGGGKGMLDYLHRRSYGPLTGRFLSVDPIQVPGRAARQPQSWNRYSGMANNPVKYVDPTGELFFIAGCGNNGDPNRCRENFALLVSALGKDGPSIRLNVDGTVSLAKGVSGAEFAQRGDFQHGLLLLIGSQQKFKLALNTGKAAGLEYSGGRYEKDVDGFSMFYVETNMFPKWLDGVKNTAETVFVHEMAHGVGDLFPDHEGWVGSTVVPDMRSVISIYEGYAVTFENRYRRAIGADLRTMYGGSSDMIMDSEIPLFPK